MEYKILICECSNTEHQLVFSSFEDESTVYVSIHLSKHGFFERLKYAIKYIFGHQCNYGAFQEILLSKKHIPQLKEIIEKLDSRTINIEKLKTLASYLIDNNKRLYNEHKKTTAIEVVGESGLGKTSAIIQLAQERGMDCIKLNLSQLEELGDLIGFPIKEYYVCTERPRLDDDGMPVVENEIVIKDEECLWVSADVLDSYIAEGYRIKDNISRMGYALPAWVPTNQNPNGTILILDDFNRAD